MDTDRDEPSAPWLAALAGRHGGWFALFLHAMQGAIGTAIAVWAVGWPKGYGRAALTGFAIGDLGAVFGFFVTLGYVDPGRRFPVVPFLFDVALLAVLLVSASTGEVASIDEHTNAILTGAGLGAVGFLGRLLSLTWRAVLYQVCGRRMPPLYREKDDDEDPIAT
jgi:hypothetical protein